MLLRRRLQYGCRLGTISIPSPLLELPIGAICVSFEHVRIDGLIDYGVVL